MAMKTLRRTLRVHPLRKAGLIFAALIGLYICYVILSDAVAEAEVYTLRVDNPPGASFQALKYYVAKHRYLQVDNGPTELFVYVYGAYTPFRDTYMVTFEVTREHRIANSSIDRFSEGI